MERVLAVIGLSSDLKATQEKAYQAVQPIHFEGMHYRKDIAAEVLGVRARVKENENRSVIDDR